MISPLTSLLSLVIMSPGYGALKEQPPRGLRISLLAAVPHLSQWRFSLQLPTDQSEEDIAHQKNTIIHPKIQQDLLCFRCHKEARKGQERLPPVPSELCLVTWLGNLHLHPVQSLLGSPISF